MLDKLRNTHKALIQKKGVYGALTLECTAHRLHMLRLDLKSISLSGHFGRLWYDFWIRSKYASAVSIAQDAHATLKSRFGEKNEATIVAKYAIGITHYLLNNYSEAIRILESLLPVVKSVLAKRHETTAEILFFAVACVQNCWKPQAGESLPQKTRCFVREALANLTEDLNQHQAFAFTHATRQLPLSSFVYLTTCYLLSNEQLQFILKN